MMVTATVALALSICASGALAPGGGEEEPKIVIQCKADADIRGAEVLLRDLAMVQTDNADLTERLMATSFGRRPAFGYSRILSREDILARLMREGLKAAVIKLAGASRVALHPVVTRLTPQDLIDAAEPVLRAALELEAHKEIEFEPTGKVRNLLVPPGRYSMELSAALRNGKLSHTSAIVNIQVLVDGEQFKLIRIPYRLRRYHHVLVPNQPIKKGTPLGSHNLELRRVEAPPGTSPYLASFEGLETKVAARDVQAGQMLTLGSLTDPAVVFKGDIVNLVVNNGRIQVTARAVALQDGAAGARILVRNMTSNKPIQAMVHGTGIVVIQPLMVRNR